MSTAIKAHVAASCGGYVAHQDGSPGETLIGWWPNQTMAEHHLEVKLAYLRKIRERNPNG